MSGPLDPTATVEAAPPMLRASDLKTRRRRVRLPLFLFLATCLSTFLVGVSHWVGVPQGLNSVAGGDFRWMIVANWERGLVYMVAVIGILLSHEMGHFITTLVYRVPASLPFFIPLPISPIGTMGAVIGMAGNKADRRQTFDIGIAGPLAGLAVILPVLWLGVMHLDLTQPRRGGMSFDFPWLVRLMFAWLRPDLQQAREVWVSQLNPWFMAGWVGLLITGLNMLPVSQLDGGHVTYALLKRKAHWVARGFLIAAMIYCVVFEAYNWLLMLALVTLIGVDHPPTYDDNVPIGWFRAILGCVSLALPFLCFPPRGFTVYL